MTDSRIGVTGGEPPIYTISGLPLPEQPYPTTIHLDGNHYVVVDVSPLVDVEGELAILRAGLLLSGVMPKPSELLAMPDEEREAWLRKSAEIVEEFADETPEEEDADGES